jgi:hypothetical protein
MDGCHNDGKAEGLFDAREPVPCPGGIVFHVQGQILLEHPDHEHQRKAGIQDAEIPQVGFPRPDCPEDHNGQGSQPDHDHKQVVGNLKMFHEV